MGLLPLSFPFPPLPFLRFDLAEIPSFVAMMTFGPSTGLLAALSHFVALLVFGEWTPIGPFMKFLAVSSSLLGFWAAALLSAGRGVKVCSITCALFGTAVRILIMSLSNYVLLAVLFPFFLDEGVRLLSAFTGIHPTTFGEKMFLVLLFTSIFNALHIPLSMIPAFLLMKTLAPISPRLGWPSPWILAVAQSRQHKKGAGGHMTPGVLPRR